jgi:hypothetical protein
MAVEFQHLTFLVSKVRYPPVVTLIHFLDVSSRKESHWQKGDSIRLYLISDHLGQQIVILHTILWPTNVKERLVVNEHSSYWFHMEKFSLKKLKEVDSKVQHYVETSNWFVASENLGSEVHNNSAWKLLERIMSISLWRWCINIRITIKIPYINNRPVLCLKHDVFMTG